MLTHRDLEKIGEKEVRDSLMRGDYIDRSEISLIESWLRERDTEHAFDTACERANKTAAFFTQKAARRANIAATIAAIAAVISTICAIISVSIKR